MTGHRSFADFTEAGDQSPEGRTRMPLYEAMGRRETGKVDLFSCVCGILVERGYR
tara:strand:+ start:1178 stop:1342 length:165 start_codon:yes stop_codon:yes gene_type:complete